MYPFHVIPYIKHNACENVKYERKAYRQEGGVYKKQPDFGYRNIKFFAQVGTYPK
jgi:hypothetical protein